MQRARATNQALLELEELEKIYELWLSIRDGERVKKDDRTRKSKKVRRIGLEAL